MATVGIVSIALWDLPPLPGEPRTVEAFVLNMYVDPAHRSRGVGGQLLRACLASATALGIRRFQLIATPDGRPLYEKHGFASNDDRLELQVATSS